MNPLRKLADRLTGQEATRAAEIERRRCEKLRASDRNNHLREIEQIRLAAIDQGVALYREPETTVDVTMVGDSEPQSMVATWVWRATMLYEPDRSAARKRLLDDMEARR